MTSVFRRLLAVPRLRWMALGLALVVVALTGVALWHLREDALRDQEREIGLLSLALTGEIGRELQGAEEGLHAMRVELLDGRLASGGPGVAAALRTRAELMPLVRTLWLVDTHGRLLGGSGSAAPPDLAGFAPPLEQLAEGDIAISRPFDEAGSHDPSVALATRFAGPPGQPDGWILAAMTDSDLLGAFAEAAPAPDARMAVFRSDGARLAGRIVAVPTGNEARMARRLANPQPLAPRQFRDGSERLVAMHELPRYGITVVLTRDVPVVLAPWREAARFTIVGLALLVALMALAVELVLRADRRRNAAQQALQAQTARAGKLESLGTLAGGVAHDFNNLLAVIVGYGEMAQDEAPAGSEQARHLDRVMQAALRGKALVERILAFSRGSGRSSTVFELQPVVEEAVAMLAASAPAGLQSRLLLEAPGARSRGDPTRALQAIMNLATNATQAMQEMPAGGVVRFGLQRRLVASPRVLSHSLLAPGNYLALTVQDQGEGITPEVMERLFEPFFTTHGDTFGTGLGLALVHGVVAEFGGGLDVESRPGEGARFTLYFPETTDPLAPHDPAAAVAPRGQGQAVLVVDDEPALVALVEAWLRGLDYQPLGLTDPLEAARLLREAPGRFDALIVDEVMPGLSGIELVTGLRPLAPGLRVLLVSGYGGPLLAQRAGEAGIARVLTKPLRRTELAQALAGLLQEAQAPR